MEDLIADLNTFMQEHVMWAAPILGLITFGESMVFIGAFFPATILMVTAGGLIGAGVLHPVPVLLWCIAGATLGDAVSYWIGRRVGPRAWRHPWLKPHRRPLARARLFFRHYGVTSIFLCRFMGPVRAFVPLIAGMTAMNHVKFQLANFFSAVVWVPVMIAPGWLVAAGLTQFSHLDEHLHSAGIIAAIALVITIVTVVAWKLISRKLIREGA